MANDQRLPPMTDDQFTALLDRMFAARSAQSAGPELETAIAAISEMARAQVAATQTLGAEVKRTVIRSNAEHENESVFNFLKGCEFCESRTRHPETAETGSGKIGHPKPALKYDTYFPKQAKVVRDDSTVLEVMLFNELGDAMAGDPMQKRTSRKGTWQAWLSPDARQLFMDAPHFTSDERNSLPELSLIIIELLHGQKAADPNRAIAENLELRRRLAELGQPVPA